MINPESTLCIKCDVDTKDHEMKGIVGLGMGSFFVCQPCGEIYRAEELKFCREYFKRENKDDRELRDEQSNRDGNS